MEPLPIDGNTSLADQQNTLRFMESAGVFLKLLTYVRSPNGGGQKANLASFERTQQLPADLILAEVAPGQNAVSIVADHMAANRQVVFHERVFVSGVEKEVFGFR
jgi:hypothetical protein